MVVYSGCVLMIKIHVFVYFIDKQIAKTQSLYFICVTLWSQLVKSLSKKPKTVSSLNFHGFMNNLLFRTILDHPVYNIKGILSIFM